MLANDLEYRILANTILTQANTLFTRLQTIIQILHKETLQNRIRVSLKKEKRGIKRVYEEVPISTAEIQWQLLSYGYTATIEYLYNSISFLSRTKPVKKEDMIKVVQMSDSLRAAIPIFSNAVFDQLNLLRSIRNIKRAIKLVLMIDHTDLQNTNILIQWVAQESSKLLEYLKNNK